VSIFRKYKTIEQLLPGFLLEKEISIQPKTFQFYERAPRVLMNWLDENGMGKRLMREISQNNIKDFFYYLAIDKNKLLIIQVKISSVLYDICTSLDWIVRSSYLMTRGNRTLFQSFFVRYSKCSAI